MAQKTDFLQHSKYRFVCFENLYKANWDGLLLWSLTLAIAKEDLASHEVEETDNIRNCIMGNQVNEYPVCLCLCPELHLGKV